MKKTQPWLPLSLCLGLCGPAARAADPPAPPASAAASPASAAPRTAAPVPRIPFERYRLNNGLEVILHQDRSAPVVFVSVWYHVGSGDETPGKSGFAHLFEHMMFQGSVHTGEDVHFKLLRKAGASQINGTTNSERTNYFEQLPSHQLELALWLESDRMGYMLPLLNEQSLKNQRDVVRNERRQRVDNVPYGRHRLAIAEALYAPGHPYRYTTIGRHEDIEAASVDDVRAFFRAWYVPANATLAIAGDFDTAEARRLVERWFGGFPTSAKPAHEPAAPTPISAPVRRVVQDSMAKLRRISYAWHSPANFKPGDAECDLLAQILANHKTGRLHRLLVVEKQLAQSASASQQSMGLSGVFQIDVTLRPEADLATVEKLVDAEVARVLAEPVTDKELERAVTEYEASYIRGLEAVSARAELLQFYNHDLGDPDYIVQDLERYRGATPQSLLAVAARTLQPKARVEILTVPAAKGATP